MPKSLKPDMPIVPYEFEKKAQFTVGIIVVSHSIPIHWGRCELLDQLLKTVQSKLDVEFVNLSLEHYQGKIPVREIGESITIHQLSGAIANLNLLLTVDTGGYYPGLVTETPIIHILPKPRFADDPKAPPKYDCNLQGFSQFSEIIDYWFSGTLEDLDAIIIRRLTQKTDLRQLKQEYTELRRSWLNP